MYALIWKHGHAGVCCVIGEYEAIMDLVYQFEKLHVKYKISNLGVYVTNPNKIVYNFWMEPSEIFE